MITEPIYRAVLSLKLDQAWNRIVEFSREYPVKRIDRDRATIVLNVGFPIHILGRSTWVEGIAISLKSISGNATIININGRVLLSPHHIFRSITLNKKKIDKDNFLSEIKIFFKNYVTAAPERTKRNNKLKMVFWSLEIFSILSFLALVQNGLRNNFQMVAISAIFFSLFQAALIIWFTRECYRRIDLSYKDRSMWITFICMTGFIGCFFYYRAYVD